MTNVTAYTSKSFNFPRDRSVTKDRLPESRGCIVLACGEAHSFRGDHWYRLTMPVLWVWSLDADGNRRKHFTAKWGRPGC